MAKKLGINKILFADACASAGSMDELMMRFELSRAQVKELRRRLKDEGFLIKPLIAMKKTTVKDCGFIDNHKKKWDNIKTFYGKRLAYCPKNGYKLDGHFIKVQELLGNL